MIEVGEKPSNSVQIYAHGDKQHRLVKIGITRSTKFTARKKAHETRGPVDVPMVTFGAWWGMESDEHYLKEYFKHLALENRKEWFNCDDEMTEWLKSIRKSGIVARNQKELDEAPFVDSRHWLPAKVKFSIPSYLKSKQGRLQFSEIDDDITGVWDDVLVSQDNVGDGDYYSPPEFIDAAKIVFGGTIDLDPASCREADKKVRARQYYSWKEDGLTQPWYGNVWLNPPYSQWDLWGDKLVDEMRSGKVKQAIVLAETRVTTAKYFYKTAKHASAYLLINGRYHFWGPKTGSPDEGHALLYFGTNPREFAKAYYLIGKTFFADNS